MPNQYPNPNETFDEVNIPQKKNKSKKINNPILKNSKI
jgi:hypothetical protein